MTEGAKEPRIEPLPEDEWSEEQRALLSRGTTDGEPRRIPWFTTLIRHPKLYKHWSAYSSVLLYRGFLSDRHREAAVMRNAALVKARMQWREHVKISLEQGFTAAEIDAIEAGDTASLDPEVSAIVTATDELHRAGVVSDETWAILRGFLDDRQLIELISLVGCYATMGWLQNSLRVAYTDDSDVTAGASAGYHQDAAAIGRDRGR